MKTLATILLFSALGFGQALPDNPSPQPTCTYRGHPCPAWLEKIIGPYPAPPDQIEFIKRQKYPLHGPRFFEFRKSWRDEPLATNKQWARSKVVWITQGASWGITTWACRREGTCRVELPAQAGAALMSSYIGYRLFSPTFTLIEPVIDTHYFWEVKHLK